MGSQFVAALAANGIVYSWGIDGSGQLKTGEAGNRPFPSQVLKELMLAQVLWVIMF
ncbi:MAG: hypothetical protein IPK03_09795 [Bacteroidetes bacterium]|nr:hypothetical protein [Bacteroidota bacterium]